METIIKWYKQADKPTKEFILKIILSLCSDEQIASILRILSKIVDYDKQKLS